MSKKWFVVLLSLCLLFLCSGTALAAPDGADRYTGTLPVYLDWQNNDGGFAPTSITLVQSASQSSVTYYYDSLGDIASTLSNEQYFDYIILNWDLELPVLVYMPGLGTAEHDYYDGYLIFRLNPSISVVPPSGTVAGYSDKFLSMEFALPNGTRLLCARTEQDPVYTVAWSDEILNRLSGTYGGTIQFTASCRINPSSSSYSGFLGVNAVSVAQGTRLNFSSNSGTGTTQSRVDYTLDYYGTSERVAEQNEELLNGYDNSSGENANSDLQSGLSAYESEEAQAHQDFSDKMDAYEAPDTTQYISGVTFVVSCVTSWWNALGLFQGVLLVAFALIIFNFISRYRGGG